MCLDYLFHGFACSCIQMEGFLSRLVICVVSGLLLLSQPTFGIRFVIDREECFTHSVQYEGDTIHASFVVIKYEGRWDYNDSGVDLVVCFDHFFKRESDISFFFFFFFIFCGGGGGGRL